MVDKGVYIAGERLTGDDGWYQDVAARAVRHPRAPVTGQAAAVLYGLDGFEPGVRIDLAVRRAANTPTSSRRRQALGDPESVGGVMVSSVEEVLVDLGDRLARRPGCRAAITRLAPEDLVELALEAALRRPLTTLERVHEICLAAAPHPPGRAVLAQALERRPAGAPPTESYLETRLVQVLRDGGLPDFERQVNIEDDRGFVGRVDLYRDGVVLEAFGKRPHADQLDHDSFRTARLAALGFTVLPFTFEHVERDPEHVVRTTQDALVSPGSRRRR